MKKQPAVYIVTNKPYGTLYTGVTTNMSRRIFEHKNPLSIESFTAKYKCTRLVYYEIFEDISTAISREKQIKSSLRSKKIKLIESMNPCWYDLYHHFIE